MNKIKAWFKNLFSNRMVNIYIIREVGADNESIEEYYFKKRKNRDLVHGQLLILDSAEHYQMWCELRNYTIGPDSWNEYVNSTTIIDKYELWDGKVVANDIRVNYYSFEETLKREQSIKNKK